jgi:hypothetical protein
VLALIGSSLSGQNPNSVVTSSVVVEGVTVRIGRLHVEVYCPKATATSNANPGTPLRLP